MNPALACHYFLPGQRLPSQIQSVTGYGQYQFILFGAEVTAWQWNRRGSNWELTNRMHRPCSSGGVLAL